MQEQLPDHPDQTPTGYKQRIAEVHRSSVAGGQSRATWPWPEWINMAVIRGNGCVINTFLDADHNDAGVMYM